MKVEPVVECDYCDNPAEFKDAVSTLFPYKILEESVACRECAIEMEWIPNPLRAV